jgi:hypothetical protein
MIWAELVGPSGPTTRFFQQSSGKQEDSKL